MFKKLLKWFSPSADNNPKQKKDEIENTVGQIIPVRAPPAPVEKYHFEVVDGTAYGEKEGVLVKLEISEPVITLIQKIKNDEFKLTFLGHEWPPSMQIWKLKHRKSGYELTIHCTELLTYNRCYVLEWGFMTGTEASSLDYYAVRHCIYKHNYRRYKISHKWRERKRSMTLKKLNSL